MVVIGPAGTGKTTALRPAVESLTAAGRPVFAVAPTATAARLLGEQAGVQTDTIDKLLTEHHRPDGPRSPFRLPAGATLIVDLWRRRDYAKSL